MGPGNRGEPFGGHDVLCWPSACCGPCGELLRHATPYPGQLWCARVRWFRPRRCAQGELQTLLGLDLPADVRLAVLQAQVYDAAAMDCFAGMFASRRNYDVARGMDADGRWRSGVIEQSWRIGGASGAEVAALEAFRANPLRRSVRASTVETYGETEPPPSHAIVHFRGADEEVGVMTEYVLVDRNELT